MAKVPDCRRRDAILRSGLVAAALFIASPAVAAPAEVLTDLNMREGPGTQYRVMTTIPRTGAVDVLGCYRDIGWCDVAWGAYQGWVSRRYLAFLGEYERPAPVVRQGPIVTFSFGTFREDIPPRYRERRRYDDRYARRGEWGWREPEWGEEPPVPDRGLARRDRGYDPYQERRYERRRNDEIVRQRPAPLQDDGLSARNSRRPPSAETNTAARTETAPPTVSRSGECPIPTRAGCTGDGPKPYTPPVVSGTEGSTTGNAP